MKISLKLKIKSAKLLRIVLLSAFSLIVGGAFFGLGLNKAVAQNVSITGTLLEPTGPTVVPNAYISIQNSNYSVYQSAYTDSLGRFSFLDAPAGSYTLRIDAYNQNYPDPLPISVTVTAGETTDLGQIRLKTPNITGRITDPAGSTGQSNVSVNLSGNGIWDYATTTSQGVFNFYIETTGTYTLQIYPAYNSTYFATKPDPSFTFSGTNVDLGDIKLMAPNITGKLTQPDGTTAVSGAYVSVRDSNWQYSRSTNTASDGAFSLYAPAGTYILEVQAWNSSYPDPAAQSITVPSSGIFALGTISLKNPNVTGILTKMDGVTPVSGASVNISKSDWTFYKYTTTNASGNFSFFLSPSGTYKIEIWANDSSEANPAPISFSYTAGETKSFTGASAITLKAPSIKGKILNTDGTPAQYASISIYDQYRSYNNTDWTSTDSNGVFKSKALAAGTYTIDVNVSSGSNGAGIVAPDSLAVSVTANATNLDYFNNPIQLQQAQKIITGTVSKPDGTKITNAYVNAWRQDGGYGWANTQTDSNGNYSFKVGKGKWQVSISPAWSNGIQPDWSYNKTPKAAAFEQSNSTAETQTVNFEVTVLDAMISGRILNPDGTAPYSGGASISARGSEGMGGGAWGQTDPSGYFTLKVGAGTYYLDIWTSNQNYAAPDLTAVTVGSGETYGLGTVKLLAKNEFIKGKITDSNGQAMANQSVNAWKATGSGWAWTQTDSSGNYTLTVTPGTWMVDAWPMYSGGMSGGTGSQTTYAKIQSPQKVALLANETKENINITFAIADAVINGTVQDSSGNILSDLYAWAEARDANQTSAGTGMMGYYSSMGGQISNGQFSIKVPAGTYAISVYLPWGSNYTASSQTTITVASGEIYDGAKVTVVENNATISGSLKDSQGNTVTGVWGTVFADNGLGGKQWAQFENGAYSLKVSAGEWRLGYWVDPYSGYLSNSSGDIKVTAIANQTATKELTILKADSTISGTVLDADGNPLKGAWVSADTQLGGRSASETTGYYWGPMFQQGASTDNNGKFSIKIPAGEYFVSVTLPPDLGYMNPKAEKVIVDAKNPATVDLRFRKSDASISGSVTLNGTASSAYVWAWSEEGGISEVYTTTGAYQINVIKNEAWHIGAIYETNSTFYRSPEYTVNVPDSGTASQNLILASTDISIPPAEIATFDSTKAKTVKLSDNTEINIPAYALASSGNVTVTATPKAQIASTATAKPIALAYDLEAKDGQNQTIASFDSDVTITLAYADAQLLALGITEDEIIPMYYDTTAGAWKNVSNVVIDKDNNKISFTVNHFTSFAITTGAVSKTVSVALSLALASPADNSSTTVDSVLVAGTVSDSAAAVSVKLNGGEAVPITAGSDGSFSKIITGLKNGVNTIQVDAIKGVDSATISRTVKFSVNSLEGSKSAATGIELEIVATTATGSSQVRVFDRNGNLKAQFFAFNKKFRGNFKVITADIDGDGYKEIIAFTGAGFGPQIRVFDHRGNLLTQFFAYQKSFRGGIEITAADINGDGRADLVVKPLSGSSNVRAYTYNSSTKKFALLDWFMAYADKFRGKINLTVADIDGDGKAEIITVPENAGGPNVRIYSYNSATSKIELLDWFMAYGNGFRGGVNLAVGDVNGDGLLEIITAPQGGGGPNVRAYQYNSSTKKFSLLSWFMAYGEKFRGGVNIKLADIDGDDDIEIITTPANSGGPNVRAYRYNSASGQFDLVDWFMAYDANSRGGVDVSIGDVDGNGKSEIITLLRSQGGLNMRAYQYNSTSGQMEMLDSATAYNANFSGQVEVKTADLNGDGDSEIIAVPIKSGAPNVRVYDLANGKLNLVKSFAAYGSNFRGGVRVVTGR
ncbi:hypothetical protein EPN15_05205 [Patescibacteria group bacterium]|nr:MAG: hypothetical protein EPN15_05205 [Patescibacteria group bacterium]